MRSRGVVAAAVLSSALLSGGWLMEHEGAARAPLDANAGLVASREQVEQARAQVVIDTAFPDPTLAADVAGQSHPLNPGSGNANDIGSVARTIIASRAALT